MKRINIISLDVESVIEMVDNSRKSGKTVLTKFDKRPKTDSINNDNSYFPCHSAIKESIRMRMSENMALNIIKVLAAGAFSKYSPNKTNKTIIPIK